MKRLCSVFLMATVLLAGLSVTSLTAGAVTAVTVSTVKGTVPTPIVGKTISTTEMCRATTNGVALTDMNWTDKDGAIYPDDTVFSAGTTYYCDMEFYVQNADYTFPENHADLEGYINGIQGEISTVYYTDHAYVTVAFTPTKAGEVYVGGIGLNDGDYLHTGSETTTKEALNDSYAFYKNGVLTLHNYSYSGMGLVGPGIFYANYGAMIYSDKTLNVTFEGDNRLADQYDAIDIVGIWSNERCDVIGTAGSSLSIAATCVGVYAETTLTITESTLTIAADELGLQANDINVQGGFLTITSDESAIVADKDVLLYQVTADLTSKNSDGIVTNGSVTLNECNCVANVYDSGIESWGGKATIYRSNIKFDAGYGVYADENDISVYNSLVNITAVYDGLFAYNGTVKISGSNLNVTSTNTGEYDNDYCALQPTQSAIVIDMNAIVLAATEPDGILTEYLPENLVTYDRVVIISTIYGDVDGDGNVSAADALEVLKSVVGKVTLTDSQILAADVDGSGNVDAADALDILKKVVGKIEKFAVEQ